MADPRYQVGQLVWFDLAYNGPSQGRVKTVVEEEDFIAYYIYIDGPSMMFTFLKLERELYDFPEQMGLMIDDMVVS